MKQDINVFDYAGHILRELSRGILLTTKANDRVNTMTISWGTLGLDWAKPQFTVFVRQNRFTKSVLDENPEFTINVPVEGKPYSRSILGVAGTKSGANIDKIATLGLTLVEPKVISVPGILELPLTLECRVTYVQDQDLAAIAPEHLARFYPQDIDGSHHDVNRDHHTAYYGEIVAAYIAQ